jgi:hypothetical protein
MALIWVIYETSDNSITILPQFQAKKYRVARGKTAEKQMKRKPVNSLMLPDRLLF